MLRKKQWTQEDPEDLFPTTYLTVHTFRNVEIKLTLRCIDEVLPIFVQLFDESVSFVQLRFVCLYFLPEAGAVQIAFTKLERITINRAVSPPAIQLKYSLTLVS